MNWNSISVTPDIFWTCLSRYIRLLQIAYRFCFLFLASKWLKHCGPNTCLQWTVCLTLEKLLIFSGDDRTEPISPQSLPNSHQINNGYALVIHNQYFRDFEIHPKRQGSEKDLNAIKIFCEESGFTIDVKENLTVDDINAYCWKLTKDKKKFRNHDGFVCFILSHGNR
jgi:hypothetical protein